MNCKKCQNGRRFAEGSIYCTLYGMIVREDHNGTRKGCEEADERIEDNHKDSAGGTELHDDSWEAIDRMQGVL